jgi:hypothetical protein
MSRSRSRLKQGKPPRKPNKPKKRGRMDPFIREQLRHEREEARRKAEAATLNPPPISVHVLRKLMKAGHVVGEGKLEITPEAAWRVDPWIWTKTKLPNMDIYHQLGTDYPEAIFINRDFQVTVFSEEGLGGWPDMWRLHMRKRNNGPVRDWSIIQRIKNSLIGPDHEAIQLYPSEARAVHARNQYHIYVLKDPHRRLPFGFREKLVLEGDF